MRIPRSIHFTLLLLALAAPAGASSQAHRQEARKLYDQAVAHLAQRTFDTRRIALDELEQATLLDPENPEYELTLARAYLQAGHVRSARQRFERVTRLAPEDAPARYGLGLVWRRDWLKYLDHTSLDRAVECFSTAARKDPSMVDAWLMLTPLLLEQGRLNAATAAAQRALLARPDVPEAQLAVAYTRFRSGDIEAADSLFGVAIPRLRAEVRERYDDISPIASERDTTRFHRLGLMEQMDFRRRFWKEQDPDPATPENELQLEYWSRVTQAYFLYYDARLHQWDERGEVYVRYGPPTHAEYNPIGFENRIIRSGMFTLVSDAPANTLVWLYPDLGMSVVMQDWLLSEQYLLPADLIEDNDPRPNPAAVAIRDDAVFTHDLKGVFPALPPGSRRLPVSGEIARFQTESGPRLIQAVEAPGSPTDSLWADWVVTDSAEVEVARVRRSLTPSPCDPTEYRVADFAAPLPPGNYRASVSVRSAHGERGVVRVETRLNADSPALALSDVLLSCGPPEPGTIPVRPSPNPSGAVGANDDVNAYFEIYHLTQDKQGSARFEYIYSVRSAERDPRIWIQRLVSPRPPAPSISASREEENVGALRRQYLTVPIQTLPPGRYWLDIRVRDLTTGDEAEGHAQFQKLEPTGPATKP